VGPAGSISMLFLIRHLARCHSERVSWQEATETVADSCD
jgi:hypothetical protein